jgi:hypothetical protein
VKVKDKTEEILIIIHPILVRWKKTKLMTTLKSWKWLSH